MAYFEKIGALLSTNGVAERILDPSLLEFITNPARKPTTLVVGRNCFKMIFKTYF